MDVLDRAKSSLKYWPKATLVGDLAKELEATRDQLQRTWLALATAQEQARVATAHWMESAKQVERLRNEVREREAVIRQLGPIRENFIQRWWRARNA